MTKRPQIASEAKWTHVTGQVKNKKVDVLTQ